MVDQLPCGSVLTPAISCTTFKIHSAHADSPMPETFFSFSFFREGQSLLHKPRNSAREYAWWTNSLVGQYLHQLSLVQSSKSIQRMSTVPWPKRSSDFTEDQSLLHRPRDSGREYAWWTNSLLGQYLHQLSLVQSSRSIQRMQTVPWPKRFFPLQILGRTSLCFTDQETQEENRHGGPTPLWVSTYTSYLLYKVQDPFSACRQSHGRKFFFVSRFFREDQSLLYRPRNSGRE